jgi:serine/threonine protein kinase
MFSLLEKRAFKPFTETEAKSIFRQTLNAMDYCHKNGIVHFDIKLDNIMIDPMTHKVTLIDFGLCDFISQENNGRFNRRVGSEEYCAAELLEKTEKPFEGTKVDIFCLGVVLFAMLSATFPFAIKKRKQAVKQGLPQPTVRFPFAISNECKDLITKMLEPNPAKRITVEQIFEHPWVSQL